MKEDKFDLTITNPVCQSIYQTISTIDEQIVANNEEEIFRNADLILRTKDDNIMQFKIEYDEKEELQKTMTVLALNSSTQKWDVMSSIILPGLQAPTDITLQ
jgi:hypothetical protein